MRWHITQPFDAGILHRRIRIKSLRDGVGNQRLALFTQQFDEAIFSNDQSVDAGRFAVEITGD